jgi:hypothetical protein
MCSIALAGLALGAGSAAASYAGQRKQAKQQARYQAQASAAERQRALREQQSIRMRQGQERAARGKERQRIAVKAMERGGTFRSAARGITGLALEAVANDITRQEAEYSASLQQQGEMSDLQTGLALADAGFGSQNRLIGINRYVPSSSLGAGLASMASAGLQGALTGHQISSAMGGRGLEIPKGSSYLPVSDQYTDPTY